MSAVLQTLAIILLPVVVPFAKKQFTNFQQYRNAKPRPYTSTELQRLLLISLAGLIHLSLLISALLFSEKNVYKITDSRLAIAIDVLKRRAANIGITMPEQFWTLLEARENVLIYLRLGAQPLLDCTWCSLNNANSFILYVLGGIALRYLFQLAVLSACTNYKVLSSWIMAAAFGAEMYIRSGGLDKYNDKSKGVSDILFIHSYAGIVRECFFLWTLAVASIKCYLDARYPTEVATPAEISLNLVHTIEKLRTSNTMQRTVGDNETFRSHASGFWTRNEAATASLDRNQALIDARESARSRMGNIKNETAKAREFVQQISSRSFE